MAEHQDDTRMDAEMENTLITFMLAASDLSAHVRRRQQALPDPQRVVLSLLDARLQPALTAAEHVYTAFLFKE